MCYHRVLDDDVYFDNDINKSHFELQMSVIHKYFNPLTLNDAIGELKKNKLPRRSIVVTFDDGYKDNVDNALNILDKWKIPAVFFITTDVLNDGVLWNDTIVESIKNTKNEYVDFSKIGLKSYKIKSHSQKLKAINDVVEKIKYQSKLQRDKYLKVVTEQCSIEDPIDLMMSDSDILKLHSYGMEIGGHSVTHPILIEESHENAKKEITKCKTYLEKLIKAPVTSFAFPNGIKDKDYKSEHVELVKKAGYLQAVTTNKGMNAKQTSPFELFRINLWEKTPIRILLRLLKLYLFKKL